MSFSALNNSSTESCADFNREDWASSYCNVNQELTNEVVLPITGSVPAELNGTFFRNGPGRFERAGQWVHHPFDGDGMIIALEFKNSEVRFSNRFVRTKAWIEEEKAKKFTYRGVFGTQKSGGFFANAFDLRLKNIANTNVVKLGNQLLALWEASNPYALNPNNLETYGITSLNGSLSKNEAFSAHPRFDHGNFHSPRMVTFGVKTGPTSTIRLMEFATKGKNAGQLINDRKDNFKGFAFLHDFAITPNWAVFLQNAIEFNPLPFILGQKGAAQCLSSSSKKNGKFWLIPRESGKFAGEPPKTIDAPKGFVFHHLNASEKDEEITIDSIHYKDFPSIKPNENFLKINFDLFPEGILKRCKINILENKISTKTISQQCCEFAMVNPNFQGHIARFSWMAIAHRARGNGPLQGIKKLDLISGDHIIWSAAPRGFVSEPIMVPKPHSMIEDEGWIIVLVWNGERRKTDLIILDSHNLKLKTTIELPLAIPHGLHGSWVSYI